jgi:hypothetical protein
VKKEFIIYIIEMIVITAIAIKVSFLLFNANHKIKPKIIEKNVYIEKSMLSEAYILESNPKLDPKIASLILKNVKRVSKIYNMNEVLLFTLIKVESNFNPLAVSKSGAIGLTQINPKVWFTKDKRYNLQTQGIATKDTLFHITKNITAGAYIYNLFYGQCTKIKNLRGQGYYSYEHCALVKYFGSKKTYYFKRYKETIGDIWFFNLRQRRIENASKPIK